MLNIIKHSVITLIIGKILEENLIYLIIYQTNCVRIGKQVHLLVNMKKDARCKPPAINATGGKSKNIIHLIIKLSNAKIRNARVHSNVQIITVS